MVCKDESPVPAYSTILQTLEDYLTGCVLMQWAYMNCNFIFVVRGALQKFGVSPYHFAV